MPFTDYFTDVAFAPTLPDYARLGQRVYIVDGINPNIALDGHEENTRIMGTFPQFTPMLATLIAGVNLVPNTTYTWAVTRVTKLGALVVESEFVIDFQKTGTTGGGLLSATIELEDYEYPPAPGAGYEMFYRIYRNAADNADFLFLVEEIDQAAFDLLPAGTQANHKLYTDTALDAALDQAFILDVSFPVSQENKFVPPVRFIREFRNRLIAGGSYPYDIGSATIMGGALDVVELQAPGVVRETDINAGFVLHDDKFLYTIIAVDTGANTWTLDRDVEAAVTEERYTMFRQFDTVYTLNPLPLNIEGYLEGTEVITNEGSSNPITGLAVAGNYAYIMRRNSIELLEESGGQFQVVPLINGVGCVGHQTIADRFSKDKVFVYAGEQGVWEIQGTARQPIHEPIRRFLDEIVDHSLDQFTHGIYNPQTGQYHLWLFKKGETPELGVRVPDLMFTYDDRLQQWYKGELAASTSALWQSIEGTLVPVIGLAGSIAQLEINTFDGADIRANIHSADIITIDSINDVSASFPTTLNGLAGFPLFIIKPDGTEFRHIIRSNTADTLFIYGEFAELPDEDWIYHVGAIKFEAETGDMEYYPRHDKHKKAWRHTTIHDPDPDAENVGNILDVTVKGVRTKAGHFVKESKSVGPVGATNPFNVEAQPDGFDESFIEGDKLGNRGRAMRTRFDQLNGRPLKIISLQLNTTQTRR
jgi:hypothetical protein